MKNLFNLLTSGIGTGSMSDTTAAFAEVFAKIQPLLSAGVNLISFAGAAFFGVKAAIAGMAIGSEKNPQQKESKKQELIGNLIAAIVAVSLGAIINVIFRSVGVTITIN